MLESIPTLVCDPIPAAQYVRMSDDGQQYSIDNQKAAIQEYAERHGFVIVRTYADAGKSGVVLNRREALRKLLEDVDLGNTDYRPSSFTMSAVGVASRILTKLHIMSSFARDLGFG